MSKEMDRVGASEEVFAAERRTHYGLPITASEEEVKAAQQVRIAAERRTFETGS